MNSLEIITTLEKVENALPPGSFKDFLNDLLSNNLGVENADMSDMLTKLEKEKIDDEALLVAYLAHLLIKSTESVVKDALIDLAMRI